MEASHALSEAYPTELTEEEVQKLGRTGLHLVETAETAAPEDEALRTEEAEMPAGVAEVAERAARPRAVEAADDGNMDPVHMFMKAASRFPLLTATEEVDLAKRIERGDLAAKEKMINSNLRLVASQARKYQGHGLDLEDLIQEGMIGLIRGVEKFDWRRGFKFSTYGTNWIRQALGRAVDEKGSTIPVKTHMAVEVRKLGGAQSSLSIKLGRAPSDEELASAMNMKLEKIGKIREAATRLHVASLDAPLEDGESTLGGLLAQKTGGSVHDQVLDKTNRANLRNAIKDLPEDEREILWRRYYSYENKPATYRELAAELGVSNQRVQQLEQKALKTLRSHPALAA